MHLHNRENVAFCGMNLIKHLAPVAALVGITSSQAAPLELNAELPDVVGKNHANEEVDFKKIGAEGYLFVYFYPKANTPGCTKQACSLQDQYRTITGKGVKVIGVSIDTAQAQTKFRADHQLEFPLIADTDGKVCDSFGVPHMAGFAMRQAFLFHNGKLVWRDLDASTKEQANDLLKQLEQLQGQKP